MKTRCMWILVCLMLAFGLSGGVSAQPDSPLLRMLARTPDIPQNRGEIYFNDRQAIALAYPPAQMPGDWDEFALLSPEAADDPDLFPLEVWWRVLINYRSSLTMRNFQAYTDMPAVVGFDFFQIDRELNVGQPPGTITQFEGRFDLERVRAALQMQDYALEPDLAGEIWCGSDGCDDGMMTNMENRNPANPFGGEIGRSQPILLADGMIASSASIDNVQAQAVVMNENRGSLAELPPYQAAVEAISQQGVLLQAYFWDGDLLLQMKEPTFIDPRLSPDQAGEIFRRLLDADFQTLPQYELLAFADIVTETHQVGRIALVYSSDADAKQAVGLLPERISGYISFAQNRPLNEMLADRKVDAVDVEVVKAAGRYVVLVSFATPKATPEQIVQLTMTNPDPPDVTAPGRVYALLTDMAIRADLGWLSTVTREELETLAGE